MTYVNFLCMLGSDVDLIALFPFYVLPAECGLFSACRPSKSMPHQDTVSNIPSNGARGLSQPDRDLLQALVRALTILTIVVGVAIVTNAVLKGMEYWGFAVQEARRDAVVVSLNTTIQGLQQATGNLGQRVSILEQQLSDHQIADKQGEINQYLEGLHKLNIGIRLEELEDRMAIEEDRERKRTEYNKRRQAEKNRQAGKKNGA